MKEIIYKTYELVFLNYFGGLLLIYLGYRLLKLTINNPSDLQYTIKGWAGGITLIFCGVVIILGEFLGKI